MLSQIVSVKGDIVLTLDMPEKCTKTFLRHSELNESTQSERAKMADFAG